MKDIRPWNYKFFIGFFYDMFSSCMPGSSWIITSNKKYLNCWNTTTTTTTTTNNNNNNNKKNAGHDVTTCLYSFFKHRQQFQSTEVLEVKQSCANQVASTKSCIRGMLLYFLCTSFIQTKKLYKTERTLVWIYELYFSIILDVRMQSKTKHAYH